jgi:hypothetical protein
VPDPGPETIAAPRAPPFGAQDQQPVAAVQHAHAVVVLLATLPPDSAAAVVRHFWNRVDLRGIAAGESAVSSLMARAKSWTGNYCGEPS